MLFEFKFNICNIFGLLIVILFIMVKEFLLRFSFLSLVKDRIFVGIDFKFLNKFKFFIVRVFGMELKENFL